jgi:hypothetical protein
LIASFRWPTNASCDNWTGNAIRLGGWSPRIQHQKSARLDMGFFNFWDQWQSRAEKTERTREREPQNRGGPVTHDMDSQRLPHYYHYVGDKPRNGRLTKIISNTVLSNITIHQQNSREPGIGHHLPNWDCYSICSSSPISAFIIFILPICQVAAVLACCPLSSVDEIWHQNEEGKGVEKGKASIESGSCIMHHMLCVI